VRALLDINVLIAIHDASHVHHERARAWLGEHVAAGWSSCAITQNGFVRVVSQPRYPLEITVSEAVALLAQSCGKSDHEFWSDDVSVVDGETIDASRVHGPKQVTDVHLLALAVRRGGRLVTLDDGIPLSAVRNASTEHLVVL
jgi:uncharacterized protein